MTHLPRLSRGAWKSTAFYLLAFFLPAVILLATFYRADIYPFGDRTLLIWDMKIQYVDFFGWLKEVLSGDGNLLYSFGKSLGGNMLALFSYYLASPLNLLVVFFSMEQLPVFITLLLCLKLCLSSVTMLVFIRQRFPKVAAWLAVLLSTSYALMQYSTMQYSNIMWLDALIWLPLVALGTFRLIRQGKAILLYVSLLFAILSNWYTGYMICLFAALYFLYEWGIFISDRQALLPWGSHPIRRTFLYKGAHFSAVGLLSAGTSAVLLLPTILALMQGKGEVEEEIFTPGFRFPFLEIFKSFSISNLEKEHLPLLFCGSLALVLCVLYFFQRSHSLPQKLLTGVLLIFMLFCTLYDPLEHIWNGFRWVYSYYCRFSFLISFLILATAARSAETLTQTDNRSLGKTAAVILGVGFLLELVVGFQSQIYFYITLLMIVLFIGLLFLQFRKSLARHTRTILTIACGVFICGELFLNSQSIYRQFTPGALTTESYASYLEEITQQTQAIQEQEETAFYRAEKTSSRLTIPYSPGSLNAAPPSDSLWLGTHGLAHYSSSYDANLSNFLVQIGYANEEIPTPYTEPILLTDSLLGLRYITHSSCPVGLTATSISETFQNNAVYQNPYALSLGYSIHSDALCSLDSNVDPFAVQNQLVSALLGEEVSCYKRLEVTQLPLAGETYDRLSWEFTMPKDVPVYGFIDAQYQGATDLYINDVYRSSYFYLNSPRVFYIGQAGDNKSATVSIGGGLSAPEYHTPYIYYLDMEVFEQVIERLSAKQFVPTVFEDGHVAGTYTAQEDGLLMLTIPQDSGWRVTINGQLVQTQTALGCFMVIPVEAGDNQVDMVYYSPGLWIGLLVSGICLTFFILLTVWLRYRRRKASIPVEVFDPKNAS